MIPLYGFVEGDTLGLLVLADADETIAEMTARLQRMASPRVAPFAAAELLHDGKVLRPGDRVGASGLAPLQRIDLRRAGSRS